MKKYILMGADVISKNDGELHFISAERLCRLYALNPRECIFANSKIPETYLGYRREDLIELWPNSEGNYSLSHSNGRRRG